jgi:hypothetical protein
MPEQLRPLQLPRSPKLVASPVPATAAINTIPYIAMPSTGCESRLWANRHPFSPPGVRDLAQAMDLEAPVVHIKYGVWETRGVDRMGEGHWSQR